MKTKDELIRELTDSRPAAIAYIRDLDPNQVIYEESGWRIKDIIAHVVTWETEMLRSLHAYRRGRSYQIENYELEDYNGFAASSKQFDPLEQTLADWDAIRSWLLIHLNAITPEALDDKMMMPWGKTETVRDLFESVLEHLQEHLDDIQAKVGTNLPDAAP